MTVQNYRAIYMFAYLLYERTNLNNAATGQILFGLDIWILFNCATTLFVVSANVDTN